MKLWQKVIQLTSEIGMMKEDQRTIETSTKKRDVIFKWYTVPSKWEKGSKVVVAAYQIIDLPMDRDRLAIRYAAIIENFCEGEESGFYGKKMKRNTRFKLRNRFETSPILLTIFSTSKELIPSIIRRSMILYGCHMHNNKYIN